MSGVGGGIPSVNLTLNAFYGLGLVGKGPTHLCVTQLTSKSLVLSPLHRWFSAWGCRRREPAVGFGSRKKWAFCLVAKSYFSDQSWKEKAKDQGVLFSSVQVSVQISQKTSALNNISILVPGGKSIFHALLYTLVYLKSRQQDFLRVGALWLQ